MDDIAEDMTPAQRAANFYQLLDLMAPEARAAIEEVMNFIAFELPKDVTLTQEKVDSWVKDVMERNRRAKSPRSAVVIPFTRDTT
jgi:hypothetical protein